MLKIKVFTAQDLTQVPKPWLEPLKDNIVKNSQVKVQEGFDLEVTIGLVDIPDQQKQQEYSIDLLNTSVIGIFGAPRSGKTTLVSRILLELARKNKSENLSYFILDFANKGCENF